MERMADIINGKSVMLPRLKSILMSFAIFIPPSFIQYVILCKDDREHESLSHNFYFVRIINVKTMMSDLPTWLVSVHLHGEMAKELQN